MHGSTLAFGTTCCLAEHFRHCRTNTQSLCNCLPMTPIGAGHRIILSDCPASPNRGRFLSHTWVKGPADFPLLIQAPNRLFEFANDEHLPVGILQSLGGQRHYVVSSSYVVATFLTAAVRARGAVALLFKQND